MPDINATPPAGQVKPTVTLSEGQLPAKLENLNKLLQSETDKRVTSALEERH